jgi:hypothetical protein
MKTQLALFTILTLLPAAGVGAQNAPAQPARPGEVSVIGCLMREADYRELRKEKKNLLDALGQGNEYVLTDARPVAGNRARQDSVGTSGSEARDYSLTGKLEEHVANDVGRMVEVVGRVDNVRSEVPKLSISVWHPVGDFCPAKK